MLYASFKNKRVNYIGITEDIITSTIFGTLSYFPSSQMAKEIWDLFQNLLTMKQAKIQVFNESVKPTNISVNLWSKVGRPEPDVWIRFDVDGKHVLSILTEVKWKHGKQISNPDSGEYQLANHWQAFHAYNNEEAIQIYLVTDLNLGMCEMQDMIQQMYKLKHENRFPEKYSFDLSSWEKRLFVVSWAEFSKLLSRVKKEARIGAWAVSVIHFLDKAMGIYPWSGFLKSLHSNIVAPPRSRLFWERRPFQGIRLGTLVKPLMVISSTPLFWMRRKGFKEVVCPLTVGLFKSEAPLFWFNVSSQ